MTIVTTGNLVSPLANGEAAPPVEPSRLAEGEMLELMESMIAATRHLQGTHRALHAQVDRLQGELAEANAQLRRSRSLAALGEMAAGIAHEIRNPLASIRLYVQVLADDLADHPDAGDFCGKIVRAVDGLEAIVRDVLAFARDRVVRPAPVDPPTVLDRALSSCQALLARRDIDVQREAIHAASFTADPTLLVQALANVIRNAIEAMHDVDGPRRLTVGVDRRPVRCPDGSRETRVVFAVQDTGPGIPPETVARMFNPFFTTRASGTGLGLAIVHRIVDAHGGHVSVKSSPNETGTGGTRLELCMPPEPSLNNHTSDGVDAGGPGARDERDASQEGDT